MFDIEMDRPPLTQLAKLARYYTIRNTVTRIVPDRLVEWAPALTGQALSGRMDGWEIEPADDAAWAT